jgi:hypothetical protein
MDRWQRVLRPRIGILVASGFALACADGPTEAPLQKETGLPSQRVIAAITCAADVSTGSLACESTRLTPSQIGPQFLIVGGQNVYVTLTSSNLDYNLRQERLRADVTLTNLIPQLLGTADGITEDSIKVFYQILPYVTGGTGTVTVAGEHGTGSFTGVDQPYYGYLGLLGQNATTEKAVWQWAASPDITFAFSVYVYAAVQYPDGWVDVTPPTASITVGGSEPLAAVVHDVVGRTGGTVTWSSSDPDIASVDPETGVVTGVDVGGPVTITASTGGPEADGTAEITVTAP